MVSMPLRPISIQKGKEYPVDKWRRKSEPYFVCEPIVFPGGGGGGIGKLCISLIHRKIAY
jgi:hypothetical protein